jgi:murein DD-endopeptidase MepM/ murein hydrolase activator NlpD
MDSIASEHRGFKTMMYFLFEPVSKIFKEMSEQVQSAPVTPTSSMTEDAMIQSSHFPKGKNPMSGSSFFNGWQKRITSHFGDGEDRAKAHGGLDIDGNQGDALDALAGGKIQFIYKDDGSSEDADGKANTRGGGTEVGVRMPDGNTYFYSHLSAVNPNLKTGSDIEAGDWIGNMGGDRGKAGSGYSTTGSHLHLGYMDAKGGLLNPEDLLNGLSAGDSSIGSMVGGANVTVSQINVNLDVTGAGASALNSATVTQLEVLVRKIVAENERLKLQLSPTKAGYG